MSHLGVRASQWLSSRLSAVCSNKGRRQVGLWNEKKKGGVGAAVHLWRLIAGDHMSTCMWLHSINVFFFPCVPAFCLYANSILGHKNCDFSFKLRVTIYFWRKWKQHSWYAVTSQLNLHMCILHPVSMGFLDQECGYLNFCDYNRNGISV